MPHQWPFRYHVSYTYCQMIIHSVACISVLNALPLDLFLLLLLPALVRRLSQSVSPCLLCSCMEYKVIIFAFKSLQDQKLEDPFRSELDSRQMPEQHIQLHYPQTEDQSGPSVPINAGFQLVPQYHSSYVAAQPVSSGSPKRALYSKHLLVYPRSASVQRK